MYNVLLEKNIDVLQKILLLTKAVGFCPIMIANLATMSMPDNQGLCRLGLEFFYNGPENIYLHQTK